MNHLVHGLITCIVYFVACFACTVQAQTEFFWSTKGLNEGATNSDLDIWVSTGENYSLFLYYSTNGPMDSDLSVGAFLDVRTTESGIIKFTAAETFDFAITESGVPVVNRWLDENGGGGSAGETGEVSDDLIDEWNAFAVAQAGGGPGILEANNGSEVFLDQGYDSGADAFLFGRIDFTVVVPAAIGGETFLVTEAGDGGIVNGTKMLDATFGNVRLRVPNCLSCPEPNFCSFAAVLMIGWAGRRRRRQKALHGV